MVSGEFEEIAAQFRQRAAARLAEFDKILDQVERELKTAPEQQSPEQKSPKQKSIEQQSPGMARAAMARAAMAGSEGRSAVPAEQPVVPARPRTQRQVQSVLRRAHGG